jgi:hypothetical protein
MGTRSITLLLDHDGEHLASIYRQFDGYPDGHGKELAALADRKVVNGIGEGFTTETHANGYSELGAKIIAGLKNKNQDGNIYLSRIKDMSGDLGWADYVYRIRSDGTGNKDNFNISYGQPIIECYEVGYKQDPKLICAIPPSEYTAWLEGYLKRLNEEEPEGDDTTTAEQTPPA